LRAIGIIAPNVLSGWVNGYFDWRVAKFLI